ncbi:hypothetical protein CSOJ01_05489 [Colletotrichum sojae]|uniref:Uncharacterized protein n=1 Tax=Colletotrichum sojae TaxID=2175907 RepID=A0A8H6JFQ1_9PEZI|nr:hypothetical protein CSOJ01_05489 [Colletotrichum sojae]
MSIVGGLEIIIDIPSISEESSLPRIAAQGITCVTTDTNVSLAVVPLRVQSFSPHNNLVPPPTASFPPAASAVAKKTKLGSPNLDHASSPGNTRRHAERETRTVRSASQGLQQPFFGQSYLVDHAGGIRMVDVTGLVARNDGELVLSWSSPGPLLVSGDRGRSCAQASRRGFLNPMPIMPWHATTRQCKECSSQDMEYHGAMCPSTEARDVPSHPSSHKITKSHTDSWATGVLWEWVACWVLLAQAAATCTGDLEAT